MSDGMEDVVGPITEQIVQRFGLSIDALKAAVEAAPNAHREATVVVRWHGLLTESQTALERAEDKLLAALDTQPSEVDDPTLDLAHRVDAAVTIRDGRAVALRLLLEPNTGGKQDVEAVRPTRRGPAVPTNPPTRSARASVPSRMAVR
ncbi:hypothetical protein ACK389_10585 [Streptomyces antibioticus]|uniref:hypothetical protein n=1 Tax=Streptomyces TaxID=1883 RepID=UPI000B3080B7|nr:hypothetical protein [Streptomyces tanashiensis]GGT22278.1 hypothetical protein GCM10010222_75220 [Streptomyces tanashiensis]